MKKPIPMKNLKPNLSILIGFLMLLNMTLLSSNDCIAQNGFSENSFISSINLNSLQNDNQEQALIILRSDKIIRHLKLTKTEKELLIQIRQMESEAKEYFKDAEVINKEISEMYVQLDKTSENDGSKISLERKITRHENYEMSLRFDAEELMEMSIGLLYNIYNSHFPTSITLLSKKANYQDFINNLNGEAQKLFRMSVNNQEKAYGNSNYRQGLDYLIKANYQKRKAIIRMEQAYALYYDIQSVINEDKDLQAILNKSNVELNKEIENPVTDILVAENKSEITNDTENNETQRLVYKVQIGAFVNAVDIKKFNGLSNLSVDSTDQDIYNKYMVGYYYSYNAACEAKKIIAGTTDYKDAFIVSYKGEARVPVVKSDENNELIMALSKK